MFDSQYNTLNSLESMSHNATTVLDTVGDYLLIHVKRFNLEREIISNGNVRKVITRIKKDTSIIGYSEDLIVKVSKLLVSYLQHEMFFFN